MKRGKACTIIIKTLNTDSQSERNIGGTFSFKNHLPYTESTNRSLLNKFDATLTSWKAWNYMAFVVILMKKLFPYSLKRKCLANAC